MKASSFYSQLTSYRDPLLRRMTCGVTSLAIVFAEMGVLDRFIERPGSLETFLAWVVSHFRYNMPLVHRLFMLDGKPVYVPVDFEDNDPELQAADQVFKRYSLEYHPTYSLGRGFDHRGTERLCRIAGVRGNIVQDYTLTELVRDVASGHVKYFLASTDYTNAVGGISTHIVVVYKVDPEKELIWFADPVKETAQEGMRVMKLDDFSRIYREYGTAIYGTR